MMINLFIIFLCGLAIVHPLNICVVKKALKNLEVNPKYPFIEIVNGILFVLLYLSFGISYDTILYYIFFSTLLFLVYIDTYYQIVPININIFLSILCILALLIQRDILISDRIIGFFIISVPIYFLAAFTGGFGGGDIKLFAVSGFFLGTQIIVMSAFIAIIIAGMFAMILIRTGIKSMKDRIPFVPFIFLGLVISTLYGDTVLRIYLNIFFI